MARNLCQRLAAFWLSVGDARFLAIGPEGWIDTGNGRVTWLCLSVVCTARTARHRGPLAGAKKKTKKDATASSSSVTPSQATTAQPKGRSDLEPDVSHRAAELVEESVYTPEESQDEEPTRRRSKDARKRNGGTRGQAADEEEIFEHRTREQQRKISKAERKRRRKLKAKERHAA